MNRTQPLPDPRRRQAVAGCAFVVISAMSPCIVLAAPGRAGAGNVPPDIRRILDRGELVVAMPAFDAPPYFHVKDGRLQGIEVDLAEAIAAALHVRMRPHRVSETMNGVVDVVARGEADLAICNLGVTLERAMVVRFSDPYLDSRHAMLLNRVRMAQIARGEPTPAAIRHFKGRIGVRGDTSYVGFGRKYFPSAEIVPFRQWDDAVRAVKAGDVDALFSEEYDVRSLFRVDPRNTLTLKPLIFTDTSNPSAIAVRHDALHLLAFVNLYLAQWREKPKVDELIRMLPTP